MSEVRLVNLQDGCKYIYDSKGIVLGEGGMGIVFLGTRIEKGGVQRKVAIKKLKMRTIEVIYRAYREGEIQLNNDNLVRMFGFLMIPTLDNVFHATNEEYTDIKNACLDGVLEGTADPEKYDYYVVSEYIEGVMLNDVLLGHLENRDGIIFPEVEQLRNRYLSNRDETATYIVKSVLSGVVALHDAGYIHRDIDPSNLMVTSEGKIKLIDFGIAKKLDLVNAEGKGKKLTTPGQFVGKAEYASPEQIYGDAVHQGPWTDVYSIGILYYELVVGRIPFDGPRYDILDAQLYKKMPLKNISSWQIRKVIKIATEKRYAKRYQTASLFRADIDRMVWPEPSSVRWGVIGGVLVLLALAAVGVWYLMRPLPPASDDNAKNIVAAPTKEELFAKYMEMMDSGNKEQANEGFLKMKKLANDSNYVDAMYEVAALYSAMGTDALRYNKGIGERKEAVGLENTNKNKDQNLDAILWLNRTIAASDSANYKALYLRASYYVDDSDNEKAKQLLNKSLETARKSGDEVFVQMCNNIKIQ